MAREYIDPQPFKDRIAELEKENAALKGKLNAVPVAEAGEQTPSDGAKVRAAMEQALGSDWIARVDPDQSLSVAQLVGAFFLAASNLTNGGTLASDKEPSDEDPTIGKLTESVASAAPESVPAGASVPTESKSE